MAAILELEVNKNSEQAYKEKKYSLPLVILMTFSRTILFLLFQTLFFVVFSIFKAQSPWQQSAAWWPFVVTVTNLVCAIVVDTLLKREGSSFRSFFIFDKVTIFKDSLMLLGLLLVSMPFAVIPNIMLGNALFGSYMEAVDLFFKPLPIWAAWTAFIVFPLTMPLGELTVYFGYVMPRLETITNSKWLSLAFPAIMLSVQHAALPLLFDLRFITWRLLMFLPFAFVIGMFVRWKPRLFPYLLIGHFIIDLMTAFSILSVALAK